jgi:hypothetical protein
MLRRAEASGIVTSFTDFQTQIEHITSIRDFPMCAGRPLALTLTLIVTLTLTL